MNVVMIETNHELLFSKQLRSNKNNHKSPSRMNEDKEKFRGSG